METIDFNDDLISVIVPVYNVLKYVNKCVDSLVSQSYQNCEIILVDDGSTDGCSAICDEFSEKYKNVICYHKENGGLSSARNYGIDRAKGEYIFFVDSDDYVHTDVLKDLHNIAKTYDADIVECNYISIPENQDVDFTFCNNDYIVEVLEHDFAVKRILDYDGLNIVAWNKLYKVELFENLRYPVGKINEDEFLTPVLIDRCKKYVKLDFSYYAYVSRADSIMNKKFTLSNLDILEAHKYRMKYFEDKVSDITKVNMKYHYLKQLIWISDNVMKIKADEMLVLQLKKEEKELFHWLMKSNLLSLEKKIKLLYYKYLKKVIK